MAYIKLLDNGKGTIAFKTKLSYFIVALPLKGAHYNKTHLLIGVTFGFSSFFETRKNDFVKKAKRLLSVRTVVFRICDITTGWISILR